MEAATLAGARVNFTDSAETFLVSKWSRIFQISFLTWTSKIQKIKLQTKELNKMADEELEKSIDDQKYTSLYNAWLIMVTEKKNAGF